MRLLIVTQKVDKNDDILGFFHRWLVEFSKYCEKVIVICLDKKDYDLPSNVEVYSLGKERGASKLSYIYRFYLYIWAYRNDHDKVFVHMNPEYVVLGGFFWRLSGKIVSLWYAHGAVPFLLRLAVPFCNVIFTSTVSGCRIVSEKVKVIGQGIDTDCFRPTAEKATSGLITVGRISPSKDYETVFEALEILGQENIYPELIIIGGPAVFSDIAYFEKLKKLVQEKNLAGRIKFVGPISNRDLPKWLQRAEIFVNMGKTESFDKAVGEAMAMGLPVLTSNIAFRDVLGGLAHRCMYQGGDAKELTEKIKEMLALPEQERTLLGRQLRNLIIAKHSLETFASRVKTELLKIT